MKMSKLAAEKENCYMPEKQEIFAGKGNVSKNLSCSTFRNKLFLTLQDLFDRRSGTSSRELFTASQLVSINRRSILRKVLFGHLFDRHTFYFKDKDLPSWYCWNLFRKINNILCFVFFSKIFSFGQIEQIYNKIFLILR